MGVRSSNAGVGSAAYRGGGGRTRRFAVEPKSNEFDPSCVSAPALGHYSRKPIDKKVSLWLIVEIAPSHRKVSGLLKLQTRRSTHPPWSGFELNTSRFERNAVENSTFINF
ncbi:hypothetical protein EVAR_6163_1 [Eumeta japonica]|uniref:Uncharacterized protein n=1 Tax=Eumeta variegata TaxID=151549 RepID=A0A4C1TEF6_EUMVA|nr:hypothetical protein EVAR_6163_1 [Eumeta japonica]